MKAVKCYCLLKKLSQGDSNKRKKILALFGNELVDAVCECAFNVMKNKVKIKDSSKKKLVKYNHHLLALSNKKVPRTVKKKIISQSGGALLPLLIPPVLGILSTIIGDKISKKINGGD